MKIADITVDCLAAYGTDLDVVNAARVSFNKESDWDWDRNAYSGDIVEKLSDKDKKLIKYLAEHNHWSPFSHCFMSFRIKAPMFVARQLGKHQVGLSWNEVSRRYVDGEPELFRPAVNEYRTRADNVKQGSGEVIRTGRAVTAYDTVKEISEACVTAYKKLLEIGICPEQARMVLPQNTMTEWIWSGSLYAFARVCNLRLDPHTQQETRVVAKVIHQYMQDNFPVSTEYLVNV